MIAATEGHALERGSEVVPGCDLSAAAGKPGGAETSAEKCEPVWKGR